MDVPNVNKLSCKNARITYDQMLFDLYGVRCFDTLDRNKYIENILYIDLIKSGYTCPQKSKC